VLRFVANGYPYNSSITWNDINGGSVGDGRWHCYEYFVQSDTNGSNGIGKIWVDNVQVFDANNLSWHNGSWSYFVLGSNQETPTNGKDSYTDYDDLAVSTSGRIGPIGAVTTAIRPSAPTNVQIIR
jgi:hypothetical protein